MQPPLPAQIEGSTHDLQVKHVEATGSLCPANHLPTDQTMPTRKGIGSFLKEDSTNLVNSLEVPRWGDQQR